MSVLDRLNRHTETQDLLWKAIEEVRESISGVYKWLLGGMLTAGVALAVQVVAALLKK